MRGFEVVTADGRVVVVRNTYDGAWNAAIEASDRAPGVPFFVSQDGCVLAATETRVDGKPGF